MTSISFNKLVTKDEPVEIKLWEIYLLYHPAKLYKILTDHSLDNGPVDGDTRNGRVVFRFKISDWESHIKNLLYQHRIPVVVQSNQYKAVKTRGALTLLGTTE